MRFLLQSSLVGMLLSTWWQMLFCFAIHFPIVPHLHSVHAFQAMAPDSLPSLNLSLRNDSNGDAVQELLEQVSQCLDLMACPFNHLFVLLSPSSLTLFLLFLLV